MKFKIFLNITLLLTGLTVLLFVVFDNIELNKPNQHEKEKLRKSEFPSDFREKEIVSSGIGINVFGRPTEHEVKLMKEAGVKWVRVDLVWSNIEKEKESYNFRDTGYDELVGLLTKYGIRPYFILDYSNNIYEKNMSITTSEGRHAFAVFAKVAAHRYRNQDAIWEIWNEPNLPNYWETQPSFKDYSLLVRHVAPGIKESDPSGKVIAPAISGVRGDSLFWLEETFKLGILNYIDAVSVHPYRLINPETVAQDYDVLNSLISKYTKKNIPIISGEWGYFLDNTLNINQAELVQAQELTRMLLVNFWKGIPVSILYEWKNSGNDPNNMHDNYGIMWNESNPKKSYYAIKNLTNVLDGYVFQKRIKTGQANDYILKFINREGKQILVVWTTDSSHFSSIKYHSGKGNLITMFGLKQEMKWGENKINIQLEKSPKYLIIK